jgi:hypothetical protein
METFGEWCEGNGTQHTQNPNLYILKNQNWHSKENPFQFYLEPHFRTDTPNQGLKIWKLNRYYLV